MTIGNRINELRREKALSEMGLADILKVDKELIVLWEKNSALPDLTDIVEISNFFNVSIDYLLKGINGETDSVGGVLNNEFRNTYLISLDEANNLIELVENEAWKVALAVSLFMMAFLPFVLLFGISEGFSNIVTREMAFSIGGILGGCFIIMGILFLSMYKIKLSKFSYLREDFKLQYGIDKVIREKLDNNEVGLCKSLAKSGALWIISLLLVMVINVFFVNSLKYYLEGGIIGIVVSIATFLPIKNVMIQCVLFRLVQIGRYSSDQKQIRECLKSIAIIYWSLAGIIYILLEVQSASLEINWIIIFIEGLIFILVIEVSKLYMKRALSSRKEWIDV